MLRLKPASNVPACRPSLISTTVARSSMAPPFDLQGDIQGRLRGMRGRRECLIVTVRGWVQPELHKKAGCLRSRLYFLALWCALRTFFLQLPAEVEYEAS